MANDTATALIGRIERLESAVKTRGLRDLDPDEAHTLAKARLANAEAERVELEVAARRLASRNAADAVTGDRNVALQLDAGQLPGAALRVSTWGVHLRDDDRSFVLRLQDSHGRDHDFIIAASDLTGIATAAFMMTGQTSYEAARLRKMIAEAEIAEAEAASLGLSKAVDGKLLVARSWSVERTKDAAGAPAFVVTMKGDGRSVEAQLTGHLAATMCGRLGLMVSELLAEPQKAR